MARKDENAQKKAAVAARRLAAMEYRKAGMTYRGIAQRLGIGSTQAFKDVQAILKEVRTLTKESAQDLIDIERETLDSVQLAIASRAAKGDLGAIDRVIRISESRRKLLGLDKPTAFDIRNLTNEKLLELIDSQIPNDSTTEAES